MVMMIRDQGNSLRRVFSIHVRDEANVLREVDKLYVRDTTALRLAFAALSASPSPSDVYGSASSSAPVTVSTGITTVSVVGGMPPYSFSWDSSGNWAAIVPTAQATGFRYTNVAPGDSQNRTFTVTVTDANGATATGQVNASVSNVF